MERGVGIVYQQALLNNLNACLPQEFSYNRFCHASCFVPALLWNVSLLKDILYPRASFKERGIKLIEEKVKPAFQKIHDYYFDVSKDNPH